MQLNIKAYLNDRLVLESTVESTRVPDLLAERATWDEWVAARGYSPEEAKAFTHAELTWVLAAIEAGKKYDTAAENLLLSTLLWMACRVSEQMEETIRHGGVNSQLRLRGAQRNGPVPRLVADENAMIMLIEDITGDLAPETASTSPAPARQPSARPRKGHHHKIAKAVAEMRAEGLLPEHLRPKVRNCRICDWLMQAGYADDLPSRQAFARFFAGLDM